MFTLDREISESLYYYEFGAGKRPNTIKSISVDLYQFNEYIKKCKDIKKIEDIDKFNFREFLVELQREHVGKRSSNRKISSLRVFFKYLLDREEIKRDPTLLVQAPAYEIEDPDVLSKEEIDKLRAVINTKNCNGLRDRLIVELLYSSGLRASEMLALGESVINLERREIFIAGAKKNRVVYFSERARRYYKKYIEAKKIKYKERYNKDIVFVNGSATRLSDRSLRRLIDRYAVRAGITREIAPSSFRHTFGLHMTREGMDTACLKELMGHAMIESTKIYKEFLRKSQKSDSLV